MILLHSMQLNLRISSIGLCNRVGDSFWYCTEIVGLVLSVESQMGVELRSYELINFATVVVTSLSNFQNPFSMPCLEQVLVSEPEKYFDL